MQIGDLAQHTGVNIETIRYYERVGVLPQPARLGNGRRVYDEADVGRLGFIRHARDLGFDLQSVQTLLALQEQPQASCADASRIAQAQLDEVERRIARLQSLQLELSRMVAECQKGVVAECRVAVAVQGNGTAAAAIGDSLLHGLAMTNMASPHVAPGRMVGPAAIAYGGTRT